MKLKKTFSFCLAFILLVGFVLPGVTATGTGETEHEHIYGQWSFDAQKGTQSRVCASCEHTQVLYGTTNKASQAEAPVVGESYYLAANVNGTLKYFTFEGSVTETKPYSLRVTDDLTNANIKRVTLEDPKSAIEGTSTGFQLTFDVSGSTRRIYCYNAESSNPAMDTGVNTANYKGRHTFELAEVSGVKVLRKLANNNILVVKYNTGINQWRMLGVPESELGSEGVYPAMLVTNHIHTYGSNYEFDNTSHWRMCDCGNKVTENHNYELDPTLGYGVCVCGADLAPHECKNTDGKWYPDGDKHYQLCGKCGQKVGEGEHTYDKWTFDTEKGTQSKLCTACQQPGQTLFGTDNKVSQVTEPVIGQSYYMLANVKGKILSFLANGGYTETKPYSLKTSEVLKTVTVNAALEAGKGEFQLVDADGKHIYSVTDGAGATVSSGYITRPDRVSFSMDEVDGVSVIRAYGTKNILVAKYSSAKSAWRIWCLPESELSQDGVYPVMLANLHTHNFSQEYEKDENQHWHLCPECEGRADVEDHEFVENQAGQRVCVCGQTPAPHTCQSADDQWYTEGDKHYQLCGICQDKIQLADHTYGEWTFDTQKGTQSAACTACGIVDTLHGTGVKAYQVLDAKVGESYYLAANVDGKLYFFRHGTVTDTAPYSLVVTDDINHNWVFQVGVEDPTMTDEKITTGFQLTYVNPTNDTLSRIYCYDVLKDSATVSGQTGVMDTGINTSTPYKNRHNFSLKQVGGQTVLSKTGNNNVLVVKYDAVLKTYRMLGVPESELGNEGVYPAMLMTLHTHNHTDETYLMDESGHWFACPCGGQSNFTEHTVAKWTYTTVPTQTTPGSKTGTCTVCGGTAVVDVPPLVEEGYYYLTGEIDGKTYYFRDKTGTESVEQTVPFSLLTSDNKNKALKVDVQWDEKSNTYVLSYTVTRTLNIYMGDVAGSIITQKDGYVDLSSSATTNESLIQFQWDPATKMFYQVEGGVRYVIAFRKMTYTDGTTQAVRMLAVPESELGADTVPVQLQVVHIHQPDDAWKSDAMNHWKECSCGARKQEGKHEVLEWTVEKNATSYDTGRKSGTCIQCGLKVVNAIAMLTDNISAPVRGVKYYLTATLGGSRYYFCHAPEGGSVADTYPYSLYTDPGTGKVTPVRVRTNSGNYSLYYGASDYRIYMNGDGVGVTTKQDESLIQFQWDKENKVLYQMEGNVPHVLVLTMLRTNSGRQMARITSMPLERALIDPNIAIIRLSTSGPVKNDTQTGSGMPEGATPLQYAENAEAEEVVLDAQTVDWDKIGPKEESDFMKWLIAMLIVAVALPIIILLVVLLKFTALGLVLFKKRNVWAGLCIIVAGVLLVVAMILPALEKETVPQLKDFTIVANDSSMVQAKELAVEIYEDHGISLPVVHCNQFSGDYGIYLNVSGFNSYGGYKYRIASSCNDETGTGIYIDGTGYALENAISKWTKSLRKATAFPFGVTETVIGYEWNTGDVNMTGLGFTLKELNTREIYEGVELKELKYDSFAYGKNTGYAVIIDADAPVELKVSAGQWDENTTPDNPGEKHTVQKHGKLLTEAGYEVLAIANAGFYDLNTTMTYIPWGMQIVDGMVKKEPNKDNPKNTDNWFAQTADGKFVISNTDGYYETYETKLAEGVGGGLVLMENGKPCFTATTPDYRTVVAITTDGDLVILTISGANYAVVTQALMDMELDVQCVLNLDGGGSTTLHTLDENGKLKQFICETPIEREVADAIAIVKKN